MVWMLFHCNSFHIHFRWHGFMKFSFMVIIENVHSLESRSISVWKWHFFIVSNTRIKCMLVCWVLGFHTCQSLTFIFAQESTAAFMDRINWLLLNIFFHEWEKKLANVMHGNRENHTLLWCTRIATVYRCMVFTRFHTSQ